MKKLKLSRQEIRKMKPMEYSKTVNKIPVTEWGKELKSPRNIFFKKVEAVIKSHDQNFVQKFLELVFRTKLKDTLKSEEFQFLSKIIKKITRTHPGWPRTEPRSPRTSLDLRFSHLISPDLTLSYVIL